MIVAVFGAAGSGKTTFGSTWASALDVPLFGPDQFRRYGWSRAVTWGKLLDEVRDADWCVVESCIAPVPYRTLLVERPSLVVLVQTDERTRGRRLYARGWPASRIRQTLNYEPPVAPDVIVEL